MHITKLFNAIESSSKTWTSILALLVGLSPLSAMANGLDTTQGFTDLPFNINGTQVMDMTTGGLVIGSGNLVISSGTVTTNGNEIISNLGGAVSNFRMIGGSYGAMLRNDGANTYLLFTAAGAQGGSWNSLRPFYVNDINGLVTMANGVSIANGLIVTSGISADYINATGTLGITSTAYYHSSDARLKTSIHPINNALDKLMSIHGVEFNWKKDGRGDMGVIAQDVAQVFPNVISKDQNGIMAVEYDSLVGPMIEAIRTLKVENDDLRQKVEALDDMKAQMTQIRDTLQTLKQENAHLRSIKLDNNGENATIKPSSNMSP
jgi:Chaperone of endosialidase